MYIAKLMRPSPRFNCTSVNDRLQAAITAWVGPCTFHLGSSCSPAGETGADVHLGIHARNRLREGAFQLSAVHLRHVQRSRDAVKQAIQDWVDQKA